MATDQTSSILRLNLMGTGNDAGSWGTNTNQNLQYVLENAVAGYVSFAMTSTSQAITYSSNSATTDQSRMAMIKVTGSLGSAATLYLPPVPKIYILNNATGYALTVSLATTGGGTTALGSTITIPVGSTQTIWTDGATGVYTINAATATTATTATTANNLNTSNNYTVNTITTNAYGGVSINSGGGITIFNNTNSSYVALQYDGTYFTSTRAFYCTYNIRGAAFIDNTFRVTSGSSITCDTNTGTIFIDFAPSGTFTVVFPANPVNGQKFSVGTYSNTITFAASPGAGTSYIGGVPSTITPTTPAQWTYWSSTGAWFRSG